MTIKLLQITDCHLGETCGEELLGLDADLSLACVLEHMQQEQKDADLLVCSGDLGNHTGMEAYNRLKSLLPKGVPQLWLPGNHDENSLMHSVAGDDFLASKALGNWQISSFDSTIPGKVPGRVEEAEILRAIEILEAAPEKHHIFFFHHPFKEVGCAWLDPQRIADAEQILARFAVYPQLKMIVSGHVHQENHQQYQHIQLYSTPSTCIQFACNSDDFAVGYEMPGYRWFELNADGTYDTAVSRIPQREFQIDREAAGY